MKPKVPTTVVGLRLPTPMFEALRSVADRSTVPVSTLARVYIAKCLRTAQERDEWHQSL